MFFKKKKDSALLKLNINTIKKQCYYGDTGFTPAMLQGFAKQLSADVRSLDLATEVIDMKDYDPDDRLADEVRPRLLWRRYDKETKSVRTENIFLNVLDVKCELKFF